MTEALQQEIRTLRSLVDSPRDPGGRVFAPLADAYRRAGRVPEALRLLNDGLAKHPDFATAHVVAACLYVEQGLGAEGALAARRALALDAENVLALRALLRTLDETGDAEAEDVRGRLLSLEPDFTPDWGTASAGAAPPLSEEAPASPDAPTVPVKALRGPVPPPLPEPVDQVPEVAADEPRWPSDAIDLSSIAPLPSVEMPVSALGPDPIAAVGEMDLVLPGSLGDDSPVGDEPLMDLSALAPDVVADEPVMDLSALAPDVVADEPVMDLSALAPDVVADEPVMDLSALAPDVVTDEMVMDLSALAPDVVADEMVMDLSALAPDVVADEPVMDLSALAPDLAPAQEAKPLAPPAPPPPAAEPAPAGISYFDEPIFDLDTLAPTRASAEVPAAASPTPPPIDDVVDIQFLSPRQPDEIVIDLDALKAEGPPPPRVEVPAPPVESVAPIAAQVVPLTPVETVAPIVAAAPPAPPSADEEDEREAEAPAGPEDQGQPVFTRTLAELYAAQGASTQAIEVLRFLQSQDPGDAEIARRVSEIEAAALPTEPVDGGAAARKDAEVEALARDLAEGGAGRHEVESPFAWTEKEPEAAEMGGPTIREYFDGLLNWEPRGDA